jgi:hypothetical protein
VKRYRIAVFLIPQARSLKHHTTTALDLPDGKMPQTSSEKRQTSIGSQNLLWLLQTKQARAAFQQRFTVDWILSGAKKRQTSNGSSQPTECDILACKQRNSRLPLMTGVRMAPDPCLHCSR